MRRLTGTSLKGRNVDGHTLIHEPVAVRVKYIVDEHSRLSEKILCVESWRVVRQDGKDDVEQADNRASKRDAARISPRN